MEDLERVARELSRRGIGGGWYWREGENIFVCTVTYHAVGKLTEVSTDYVVIEPAALVSDFGRFGTALREGFGWEAKIDPIEGPLVIQRLTIVASMKWKHDVPQTEDMPLPYISNGLVSLEKGDS